MRLDLASTVYQFSLATKDHDLAEVDQDRDSRTRFLFAEPDGVRGWCAGRSRGDTAIGRGIQAVVEAASGLLGPSEISDFLREAYRPDETLGSGFARLFARLFADWGVILLDAADQELHSIAVPIYRAAVERLAAELDDALLARGAAPLRRRATIASQSDTVVHPIVHAAKWRLSPAASPGQWKRYY